MSTPLKIYEILVPTMYGDTETPISTRHHKNWDAYIRKITGGLTIFGVAKGQWVHNDTKKLYVERVIPVRVACNESEIKGLIKFTLAHYRQKAVMYYLVSSEVVIQYA